MWTLAIFAVIVLPILSFALPAWAVVVRTAPMTTADAGLVMDPVRESADDASPSSLAAARLASASVTAPAAVSWPTVVITVYSAGLLVMLIHLAIQRRSLRRLSGEASEVEDRRMDTALSDCARSMEVQRQVRLLRSREQSMPMAFGTYRPAIVIPAIADTWSYDRRRAVVLHELAHVARYDCLTQTLAFVACAIYWFHPGAWWAARRLRIEREIACDDRVIAAGAHAREYAGHLLEIAYASSSQRAPALAVGMARPRQLEGRMLAVLDAARDRTRSAHSPPCGERRDRSRGARSIGDRDRHDRAGDCRRRSRSGGRGSTRGDCAGCRCRDRIGTNAAPRHVGNSADDCRGHCSFAAD